MKRFLLWLVILLYLMICGAGCSRLLIGNIDMEDDGSISFSADRPFNATYEKDKDGKITATMDMKGETLVNLGNLPVPQYSVGK